MNTAEQSDMANERNRYDMQASLSFQTLFFQHFFPSYLNVVNAFNEKQ